jgi:thioredoxin reductase (NADPH)
MWDCAIIGGGPAGLTAAVYLARFRRKVIVIDAGGSRLKRIPRAHNLPGFDEGIVGAHLHARMIAHAKNFGAVLTEGQVDALVRNGATFALGAGSERIEARTVLLATGVKMGEPEASDLQAGVERGVLCYCPICDGYENRGRNIGVLAGRAGALKEAHFLRAYSDRVSFLWLPGAEPDEAERAEAVAAGIEVARAAVEAFEIDQAPAVRFVNGEAARFDVVYPCFGCDPVTDLVKALDVKIAPEGGVVADPHQRSSVAGIYAAGDVVQGLDQIATACGQGAIAATAIHNDLRAAERQALI